MKKNFFRVSGRNEHGDPTLLFDVEFEFSLRIGVALRENAATQFDSSVQFPETSTLRFPYHPLPTLYARSRAKKTTPPAAGRLSHFMD